MTRFFLILFLISFGFVPAQNDSLWKGYCDKTNKDTVRWNYLADFANDFLYSDPDSCIKIADLLLKESKNYNGKHYEIRAASIAATAYIYMDQIDKAIPLFEKQIEYNEKHGDRTDLGGVYINYAMALLHSFNYSKGEYFLRKAMNIAEETKEKRLSAIVYNQYSTYYYRLGNYSKAIEYTLKELRISENEPGLDPCGSLINLGIFYDNLNEPEKATEYLLKGLNAARKSNNKNFEANALQSLGVKFYEKGDLKKALSYYNECLKINEAIGSKSGVGNIYQAFGLIAEKEGKIKEALDYFNKALNIYHDIQELSSESLAYSVISGLYLKEKNFAQATRFAKKGLEVARASRSLSNINDLLMRLYEIYKTKGDKSSALPYYEEYVSLKDSMFNDEKRKSVVQNELKFEYEKQAAADSVANAAKLKEERILNEEAVKQQRTYTYAGLAGFGLMIIIAGISFRAFRNKQKANLIISKQKQVAEHQKQVIEEKQKEIVDSITYARRIQKALITNEKYIHKEIKRMNKLFLLLFTLTIFKSQAQDVTLWKTYNDKSKTDSVRLMALAEFASGFYYVDPDSSIKLASLLTKENQKPGIAYITMRSNMIMANSYTMLEENEKAMPYFEKAIEYFKHVNDKGGLGGVYCNMAQAYNNVYNYSKTEECLRKALVLAKESGESRLLVSVYSRFGAYYYRLGNFSKSIEYALLELKEKEKDPKADISGALVNIGIIYEEFSELDNAREYYEKGLAEALKHNNKHYAANALYSMGSIKNDIDFDAAENYFKQALALYKEVGAPKGISSTYGALGVVAKSRNDFVKALGYYESALKIKQEIGDVQGQAMTLYYMGEIYTSQKNFAKAIDYFNKGLESARTSKNLETINYLLSGLYNAYKQKGEKARALDYFEEYVKVKDSIFNDENRRAVMQNGLKYQYEKQAAADSVANLAKINEERILNEQNVKQQRTYTYAGLAGFGLMLIIAGVSFRAYKNKQKANVLISEQKRLVEEQKHMIEEKQKEVLDSITYARRIQSALITNENYISKEMKRLVR